VRERKPLSSRTPYYPTERVGSTFDDVLEASAEPKTSHFPVSSRLQAFEQPWREEIPAALLWLMSTCLFSPSAGPQLGEDFGG
jgi:hypothetical protein